MIFARLERSRRGRVSVAPGADVTLGVVWLTTQRADRAPACRNLQRVIGHGTHLRTRRVQVRHRRVLARLSTLDSRPSPDRVYVVDGAKVYPELLPRCDSFWVIYTPEPQQLERLVKDRGVSEEEARRRIAAQVPWEERLRQADVVIDNSGTLEETRRQVERQWQKLLI